MSKAGKMVLLGSLLILALGATPQIQAQEKLIAQELSLKTKVFCSPIQTVLPTQRVNCDLQKLTQIDIAKKASALEENEFLNTISYSIDPTYFIPEKKPEPTVAPIETAVSAITLNPIQKAPLDMVPADGQNLDTGLIFDLINAHRASIGKAPFQKEEALCSLASARSTELSLEFSNGTLHSGLYNRKLPYWITENAKWGSNESGTVKWWLNSPIHRRAIEGDYTYSCGACQGSKCAQLFTSFTPKGYSVSTRPTISPVAQQN